MARKITEISLSQTFLGDFLISVHSITAVSLAIVITEKSMEGWLMKQKYYLALTRQMAVAEGVTEQLKAGNQMAWAGKMNSIRNRAAEIINTEIIYT